MRDLVTIIDFWFETQAALAIGYLESEGIECYYKDEHINALFFYSNAIKGIKIQVRDVPAFYFNRIGFNHPCYHGEMDEFTANKIDYL